MGVDKNKFDEIWGYVNEMRNSGELPVTYSYNFEDDDSDAMANNELLHAAVRRRQAKKAQLDALNQMRKPEMSQQMETRLKALEQESRPTSLVEDPYYQSQRATLVQGGQQALSGIQNTQKAQGVSGGFSNTGSIADVYDRMGTQLASLGQQSKELKDKKADAAAQARQEYLNSQIEYDNMIAQARAAIEVGDSEAATAAMQRAIDLKAKAEASSKQFWSTLGSGVINAAGTVAGVALAPATGGLSLAIPAATGAASKFAFNDSNSMVPSSYNSDAFGSIGGDYGSYKPTWSNLRKK